jgi:uncharacterized protein (TIGR02678 family)
MKAAHELEPSHAPERARIRGAVPLSRELAQVVAAERQRALRALLARPLLGPDRAVELALVRRHAAWLQDWLARNAQWRLQVDPEHARLRKTPGDLGDGTRPARDPVSGAPFTRRRYVLLCLALAALERSDRQTTLGRLAEDVMALTAADPGLARAGIAFDMSSRDQRRDLVQVVRLLLDLRVLARVHGEEQQYLEKRGDVLYGISRPALAAMPNVRRGPSTVEATDLESRLRAVAEEVRPDSDEARNRALRTRLTRQLLDDPIVYHDTLTEEEKAYLASQRGHLVRQVAEATGLAPEVRLEGIALVDDRGDLTDVAIPEEGTEGHLTILLAEHLARSARERPGLAVGTAELQRHVAALAARHRGRWRRDATLPGAEVELTERTLERLESLRLVRRTPEGAVPLPAIGRYALDETPAEEASPRLALER